MIKFDAILNPLCVSVGKHAADKDQALRFGAELLASGGKVADPKLLLGELNARERLASTGIGFGVAVPHALGEFAQDTIMAALRLDRPVDFGAPDGQPVDLLFIIAGPRGATGQYLQLLSKLARMLQERTFRQAVRSAPDPAALAKLFLSQDRGRP